MPLRLLASAVAGFITFFAIAALLSSTGEYYFAERYHSLWGLAHSIAQRIDPPRLASEDELFGPFGGFVDFSLGIGFWTLVFGLAYFHFIFRRRRAI